MAERDEAVGGFPERGTTGQDEHSTTGDGHPPRQTEEGYEQGRSEPGTAGQGAGQIGGRNEPAR